MQAALAAALRTFLPHPLFPAAVGQEYPAQQPVRVGFVQEDLLCIFVPAPIPLPSRGKYLGWNLHLSPNVSAQISMPWVGFVLITCALL